MRLWLKRSLFLLVVGAVKPGLERSVDQFKPAEEKDVS